MIRITSIIKILIKESVAGTVFVLVNDLVMLTLALLIITALTTTNALADPYLDPVARTNINKVDPLFKESINDYDDFERTMDSKIQDGINNASNKSAYKDLPGGKGADAKAAELDSINVNELASRGREEYAKDHKIDGIFVDYSKPGMMRHRDDAKLIADASAKLNDNLFAHLKNLGVNCRTVKGNKVVHPEYFIQIKKVTDREKGDTVYDQYMCEQLYNRYSCTDSLTLTCLRRGMRYEEWQDKTMEIPGGDIYWQHNNWVRSIKWKASTFGIHMRPPEPALMNEIRTFIAIANGVGLEHIHEYITYGERGEGNIFHLEGKSHTWDKFIFKYKYRDGKMVCLDWKEDWSERCRLN